MNAADFIGRRVSVEIDRPLGSRHPEHGFRYDTNYGYVPGAVAPDGEALDAYVLGVNEPRERFEGDCIAVIHRLDDVEDKLVIVPPGENVDDGRIRRETDFQEWFFQSVILRG
jgi:inorganic pyrophosphatase